MPQKDYYLPKRKLVSQDDASIIESPHIPRSKFIGAKTRRMTFDQSYLVPFFVDEILPGDHMKYNVTAYIRMSTPLFPLFDNQRIDTFFFFVPCRILWANWTKFMGEQANPADSISFTVPRVVSANGGFPVNTIYDHMGIPGVGQVLAGQPIGVNALPLRAYNKIFNAWFRDENLVNSATERTTDDGTDLITDFNLLVRAKAHDYFTSALPWPQKFTAPSVPLSGTAPITGIAFESADADAAGTPTGREPGSAPNVAGNFATGWQGYMDSESAARTVYFRSWGQSGVGTSQTPQIFADLTLATGVSINQLRLAFLTQQLLERDARGGTRYVELIKSHFGVTSPDFRLQRPEYIGGGQSPLNITPIAQTAPTSAPAGTLGALGAAATSVGQHRASYAATEHGYILGLINVRSELAYQQGLHRLWTRLTRYDFYFPALAQLGEQTILNREIYLQGDFNDTGVFGYQERWHEYRTMYSDISGMFRSTTAATIDSWHLAQKFATMPTLNETFIRDTAPMTRVLAAGAGANSQQYLADILIQREAVRPLPTFGTPAMLGRF